VPPPSSEAELEKKADIVVEAESSFVVCNGLAKQGVVRVQSYVASLRALKWHKGAKVEPLTVEGAVAIDPLPPGPVPSPPLPRGWRGKLYLVKVTKNLYALAAPDAAIEDKRQSVPSELPHCSESDEAGAAPVVASAESDATPPPRQADAAVTAKAEKHESRGCGGCSAGHRDRQEAGLVLMVVLAGLAGFRRNRSSII